jgi:hypothetical protein
VCLSKKSWQARHTGIKIVQQIAILMGCAVLPHLKALVDIIKHGLQDENQKVGVGVNRWVTHSNNLRTVTSLRVLSGCESGCLRG